MPLSLLILASQESAVLVSIYKPILLAATFLPWAWLVSSKLDKDARFYHFAVTHWNTAHLVAGAAALAAGLFIPIFWIGWPVALLVLAGPVLVYWKYRNDRVPEEERFRLSGEGIGAALERRRSAKLTREALLRFTDSADKQRTPPDNDSPLHRVHMLAEDLIGPALDSRAGFLDMLIAKDGAQVGQSIDGIRYKREPLPAEASLSLLDFLKDLAGCDVADRRRRQTGRFSLTGPRGRTIVNLTTQGSSQGIVLRLDFDRAERLNRAYDTLGLLPPQKQVLDELQSGPGRRGIVLVSSPPGHGLSSTLYALLGRHDAYTSNIKTLEREVMVRHDGVDHQQWTGLAGEPEYATALQSILRRDPDIVLTDFIKDAETARVVTDPGPDGPLIYIPIRAGSTAEAIDLWMQTVGDPKRAVRSLKAVTCQRLVRTLCPQCRQAYQPTAEQLARLGLPAGKVTQLYRANGKVQVKNRIEPCPVCNGIGYFGQTAIFEVFGIDDEARKLLVKGDIKNALLHARRNRMPILQQAALARLAAGDTTPEEIVRVTAPNRKSDAA